MRGGGKACWKTIHLEAVDGPCPDAPAGGGDSLHEMTRLERLAALYRFQRGEAQRGLRFVDPSRKAVVTDPADVDWTHFPEFDALEAVTREELCRLRALLRPDA